MTTSKNTNSESGKWMIISWRNVAHLEGRYGRLLDTVTGSEEDAKCLARKYVEGWKPIGIVREVEL